MYAQDKPGRPKGKETADMRIDWFRDCLIQIGTVFPEGSRLYFPYGIGCGLAGGDWNMYSAILKVFAESYNMNVIICKFVMF